MEIMKYIATSVNRKNFAFYIFLVIPGILFLYYIWETVPQGSVGVKFGYFCYYLSPLGLVLIAYIWLYFAPVFCSNVSELKEAFDGNAEYGKLYDSYIVWTRQFMITPQSASSAVKMVFFFLWTAGCTFLVIFLFRMGLVPPGKAGYAYGCLMVIPIILNFSSYYNCVALVYFIMRTEKLELRYNRIQPSATYGFQALEKAANTIYMFFLLDSSLCTVFYLILLYLYMPRSGAGLDPFMFGYTASFLGGFGLLSWVGISFVLKTYLRRIHTKWKMSSLRSLQELLYRAEEAGNEEGVERVCAQIERVCQDRISRNTFEWIVSVITFLINVLGASSPIWAPLI